MGKHGITPLTPGQNPRNDGKLSIPPLGGIHLTGLGWGLRPAQDQSRGDSSQSCLEIITALSPQGRMQGGLGVLYAHYYDTIRQTIGCVRSV
jgi:hypothetical protein